MRWLIDGTGVEDSGSMKMRLMFALVAVADSGGTVVDYVPVIDSIEFSVP